MGILGHANSNLKIYSNNIDNTGYGGIAIREIDFENISTGGIEIHRNLINNVKVGINPLLSDYSKCDESNYIYITHNIISTDNDFYLYSFSPNIGILLVQANSIVENNTFDFIQREGTSSHAITIYGDTNSQISNNRIISAHIAFDFALNIGLAQYGNVINPAKFEVKYNTIESCVVGVYIRSENGIVLNSTDRKFFANNFYSFVFPVFSYLIPGQHFEDYSHNYWRGLSADQIVAYVPPETLATILFAPVALSPFIF